MDGRYGSLQERQNLIEYNNETRYQDRVKSPGLGLVLITLVVVLVIVILIGYFYYRLAPSSIFSSTLINETQNGSNTGGGGALPTDGSAGSVCVADSDCGPGYECSNDQCCFFGDPVIVNVVSEIDNPSFIRVIYTHGPQFTLGSIVEVILQTPTGQEIASKIEIANGTTEILESDFNSPVKKIFPDTLYAVKLRITYSCGENQNTTTNFTVPLTFSTDACALQPVGFVGIQSLFFNQFYNFISGTVVDLAGNTPATHTFLVSTTPGLHPNFSEVVYPNVTSQINAFFQSYAPLPYLGAVGDTFYLRYYAPSGQGECNSNLSDEYTYTLVVV